MSEERSMTGEQMDRRSETARYWGVMNFYQRFEHLVALVLITLIALVILVALWRLSVNVFETLVFRGLDPLDHGVFQTTFGMIMTLLIAMEFKHSILRVMDRSEHIVQARTVVLIALLALARKFIILDTGTTPPAVIAALGFSLLALGVVWYLLRRQE